MELKELKNENEQLKSGHQNEIEMIKKKHKQQLAKMALLIQEFNSEQNKELKFQAIIFAK